MDNSNANDSLYYSYTDNQGSVIALTDESGNVKRKYAYDPWGDRRNPVDWTQKDNGSNLIINRGYTGHEHLDQFAIINMNGRVYDPLTAMFFSPDPFIQSTGDWKNYNRYSYCMNNPTRYTDPSGYVRMSLQEALDFLWSNPDGGTWTNSGGGSGDADRFSSQSEALSWGAAYNDRFNSWSYTELGSRNETVKAYNLQRAFQSGQVIKVGIRNGNDLSFFCYLDKASGKFYNMDSSLEIDPYSEYNISNAGDNTGDDWLETVNNYTGIATTLITGGIEGVNAIIRNQFKSATSWTGWTKLRNSQQAWRMANVLGKGGTATLKIAGGVGGVLSGLSAGYSTYKVGSQLYTGGLNNVNGWDLADATVGWAGVASSAALLLGASNPVGWALLGVGAAGYGAYRAGDYIYENFIK